VGRAAATNSQVASISLPPSGGGGRAGRQETLAPDPRVGSGYDDPNDGCKRFAETEPRRAESSEGKLLTPQPISACPGDSCPPLHTSPQQPAYHSQSKNSFVAWLPPRGCNKPSNATSIGHNDMLPRRIGILDQPAKGIGVDRPVKGESLIPWKKTLPLGSSSLAPKLTSSFKNLD
jgi:hypothetical protein